MKYVGYSESQEALMVRGHPGSGKSSMANAFELNGYQNFENDSYFTDEFGEYKFVLEDHQKAKDDCLKKAKKAMDRGSSVVISNTFTKLSEMAPFIEHAEKLGIPVRVIEMELNFNNVHNVPDFVVEDKKKQFEPFEGAIKIDDEKYSVIREQDVKWMQVLSYVSAYDGTYDIPSHYVNDSVNKLRVVLHYLKEELRDNEADYKENGSVDIHKKEIKFLNECLTLLENGEALKFINKIDDADMMLTQNLPIDLSLLSGFSILDEKSNSSRFNDMESDEIKDKFVEIIHQYKKDPEKAKQLDASFSKDFFVDAEMMLRFEDTRKRRLGY